MKRYDDLARRFDASYASRTPDHAVIGFLETVVASTRREELGTRERKDAKAFYETWQISDLTGIYGQQASRYLAAAQRMDDEHALKELSILFPRLARSS